MPLKKCCELSTPERALYTRHLEFTYKALEADDWSDVLQFMSDGFQPSKLVSHRIALEKLPETLSKMYLHKCRETVFSYVKVVIENE